MTKRTVTETVYEYDKNGNLIKKTVIETHEEDYPTSTPSLTTTDWWKQTYVSTSPSDSISTTTATKLNSNNCAVETTSDYFMA